MFRTTQVEKLTPANQRLLILSMANRRLVWLSVGALLTVPDSLPALLLVCFACLSHLALIILPSPDRELATTPISDRSPAKPALAPAVDPPKLGPPSITY